MARRTGYRKPLLDPAPLPPPSRTGKGKGKKGKGGRVEEEEEEHAPLDPARRVEVDAAREAAAKDLEEAKRREQRVREVYPRTPL